MACATTAAENKATSLSTVALAGKNEPKGRVPAPNAEGPCAASKPVSANIAWWKMPVATSAGKTKKKIESVAARGFGDETERRQIVQPRPDKKCRDRCVDDTDTEGERDGNAGKLPAAHEPRRCKCQRGSHSKFDDGR